MPKILPRNLEMGPGDMEDCTVVIRKIEEEVLDRVYQSYSLLSKPEDLAITRLLKVTGDTLRDFSGRSGENYDALSKHTIGSLLTRALSHCLRWVCSDCPAGPAVQGPQWKDEDEEASALLQWGTQYARLATDHVAWSNSLLRAGVDSRNKIITFYPPEDFDFDFFFRQCEADLRYWYDDVYSSFPSQSYQAIYEIWKQSIVFSDGEFDFDPEVIASHEEFLVIERWMASLMFPELPETCTIGSYNLAELRRFFSVLYIISSCIFDLESHVDNDLGEENWLGSLTFQDERPRLIEWLAHATGLAVTAVDPIVDDLTLNPTRFHCSITTTPFVLSRSNTLFLLPRLFSILDPQRSFACSLTCGTGRKNYDRISTLVENLHLFKLAEILSHYGLKVYRERKLVAPDGSIITPDFLVFDNCTSDVLVIDYKNALAATSVSEVTSRLKEYRKGVSQVGRYVEVLTRSTQLLKPFLGQLLPLDPLPVNIVGLLLFRVPMPLPVPKIESVVVDDWYSLRKRLKSSSIQRLTIRELLPVKMLFDDQRHPRFHYDDIPVANWVYQRSVLFIPNEDASGSTAGG